MKLDCLRCRIRDRRIFRCSEAIDPVARIGVQTMTTSATVIESAPAKATKPAKAPSDNPITGEITTAATLRSYADETVRLVRSGIRFDRTTVLRDGLAKFQTALADWNTKVQSRLAVLKSADSRVNYTISSGTNITGGRAASAILGEDKTVIASFSSK